MARGNGKMGGREKVVRISQPQTAEMVRGSG